MKPLAIALLLVATSCGSATVVHTTPGHRTDSYPDDYLGIHESRLMAQARAAMAEHEAAQRASRSLTRPRTVRIGGGSLRSPQRPGACSLDYIKAHESGGDYGAVSRNGHQGAWQFDARTWHGAVARAGYPEWSNRPANEAPADVQDAAARQLYSERGSAPWSVCR